MKFLNNICFENYFSSLGINIQTAYNAIKDKEWTVGNYNTYTATSVISSLKIEGEKLEVEDYLKHKLERAEYPAELLVKPNDLFAAYEFASDNKLTISNFLKAHGIAMAHALPAAKRGKIRTGNMSVVDPQTKEVRYKAAGSTLVKPEFETFWKELAIRIYKPIGIDKVFYYAALIHLVFVNIHPFEDGNGRAARLLEKWFLASKLGAKAWFINSEKFYYDNMQEYFDNLAQVGASYNELDYHNSTPFLVMLANSLVI
ncbi:MAG: Fic family protein [Bacteroidota bacterium]